MNDPEMKKALIAQSLRALSEARFQLGLTMQSDIKYLADGEFKMGKGKSVGLIDSRINSIKTSFAFIHHAWMHISAMYLRTRCLLTIWPVFLSSILILRTPQDGSL